MSGRYRLVGAIVTPLIVWDDGDDLTEINAQPVRVAAVDLDGLGPSLRSQLEEIPRPS